MTTERITIGTRITIDRFPYNRPNEVRPNAPEPTHRVIGFDPDGYLRIFPLRGTLSSRLPRGDAIVF